MSQHTPYPTRIQNFLDALDADIDTDIGVLAQRHDIPAVEAHALAHTIRRLDAALVPIVPDEGFRARLKADLLGEPPVSGVFGRVRNLPPRLQVAAAVALFAAMTLLGRRRLMSEAGDLIDLFRDGPQEGGEVEVVTH